jgi:hypothetical protein
MSRVPDVCAFTGQEHDVRFKSRSETPDLHTQLESLLDQVWRSESDWRLWDRVDAAVRLETIRERRAAANRETRSRLG